MSLNLKPEAERDCNTCQYNRQGVVCRLQRRVDVKLGAVKVYTVIGADLQGLACIDSPALPLYEPDEEIVCKNRS